MNSRLSFILSFALPFVFSAGTQQLRCAPAGPQSSQSTHAALQKLAGHPPDPCGAKSGIDDDVVAFGRDAFKQAVTAVSEAMNAESAAVATPAQRATEALEQVQRLSAEVNADWPEENRFRFEVLDVAPIVVVKMTLGTIDTFYLLAQSATDSFEPNRKWHEAGSDEFGYEDRPPMRSRIELFPRHRGPSGDARFLASVFFGGCAGSFGIEYEVHEWDPKLGSNSEILKQAGAFGMDEAADGNKPSENHPFAPIGKLKVEGAVVQLPYCIWSRIDWWDNPSLCALDTYDFSGDSVQFVSRAWNRPELVPIAKALEYAAAHDYPATLAYCTSPALARRFVRDVPGIESAENPKVTRRGVDKLRVEFGGEFLFDLEKHGGRWLIAAYHEL